MRALLLAGLFMLFMPGAAPTQHTEGGYKNQYIYHDPQDVFHDVGVCEAQRQQWKADMAARTRRIHEQQSRARH